MIIISTETIDDPRAINVNEDHELWFEGTNMPMYREYLRTPSDAAKKALNGIYIANRDGICVICCKRVDIAIEIRRTIYDKSMEITGAPIGERVLSKCSLLIEYLEQKKDAKGLSVHSSVSCGGLLIKETEMFPGFICTPEMFMSKLVNRRKLDKKNFSDNHYKWAAGKPFRAKVYNVEPIDPNNAIPSHKKEKISSMEIDYLYLPPKAKPSGAGNITAGELW